MENTLNDDEFIFYQKGGNILSIGMKFDNIFRKHNLPAMIGGSNKGKSTASLGLPIGLNFIKQNNEDLDFDFKPNVMKGGVIKNEIYYCNEFQLLYIYTMVIFYSRVVILFGDNPYDHPVLFIRLIAHIYVIGSAKKTVLHCLVKRKMDANRSKTRPCCNINNIVI